jgi:hypothetical protein
MGKFDCVLYVEPIDAYAERDHGRLLKVDPSPGVQKVPTPDPEGTKDGDSIFTPNPDLVLP